MEDGLEDKRKSESTRTTVAILSRSKYACVGFDGRAQGLSRRTSGT